MTVEEIVYPAEEYAFDDWSVEEMQARVNALQYEIEDIKDDIDHANRMNGRAGQEIDFNWRHRAQKAKRYRERERKALLDELGKRKRAETVAKDQRFDQVLIRTCRELLADRWPDVIRIAQSRMGPRVMTEGDL